MAKFDNTQVAARPSANAQFFTVAPGEYRAIIRTIEDKPSYFGKFKEHVNPDREDGKWQWEKIVPTFELLNADHTIIKNQDMTIGIFKDGAPFTPSEKGSAVFTGWYNGNLGAGTLLAAIGLMVYETNDINKNEATLRGDTSVIRDAVVNIRTSVGLYNKSKVSYGPDQTLALLKEQNGGELPTFAQYHNLVVAYNAANGLEGDDALRMKNFVVDIQPLSDAEVAAGGYFRDTLGTVYLTKASSTAANTPAGSTANW